MSDDFIGVPFALTDTQWAELQALLNRPAVPKPKLMQLLIYGEPYRVTCGESGPETVTFDDGGEIIPRDHN